MSFFLVEVDVSMWLSVRVPVVTEKRSLRTTEIAVFVEVHGVGGVRLQSVQVNFDSGELFSARFLRTFEVHVAFYLVRIKIRYRFHQVCFVC